MAQTVLRIGELAVACGASIDTIRYYERRILLPHAGRTVRGFRLYTPEAVETMMKRIRRRSGRRTVVSGWQLLLAICCAVLPAMPQISVEAQIEQQSTQSTASSPELSLQEKKVIEYLQGVWGKDHSVTSVDQAMEVVGLGASDETRFRTGEYIKQHPELHVIIRQWGWETLVLTPDENAPRRQVRRRESHTIAPGVAPSRDPTQDQLTLDAPASLACAS